MADLEDLSRANSVPAEDRDNVADDVRAAFNEHKELAEKLVNDPVETPAAKATRLRDEATGKFVAKDSTVEQSQTAAPDAKITDADSVPGKIDQPSTAGELPKTWSADAKAAWSTLPPAVQQAVLKRESEMDAGGRQWSEQRQAYERVLSPVAELSRQNGLTTEDGIQRLLSVEQRLQTDGPNMIRELANAYGVDLAALANGTQQPQVQRAPQFDPNQIPILVNQTLQEELARRDQQTALQTQISAFASQPGHEHFDTVKVKMGRLLETGEATSLQDAYEQAVWANPSTRSAMQAATQQAPSAEKNAKARKAAVSINGSPRGQAPVNRVNGSGSIEDDVRAAWNQHSGQG